MTADLSDCHAKVSEQREMLFMKNNASIENYAPLSKWTLTKKGRITKCVKKRYFDVLNGHLVYFKKQTSTHPSGLLSLKGAICSLHGPGDNNQKTICIEIQSPYRRWGKVVLHLHGSDQKEIDQLRKAIYSAGGYDSFDYDRIRNAGLVQTTSIVDKSFLDKTNSKSNNETYNDTTAPSDEYLNFDTTQEEPFRFIDELDDYSIVKGNQRILISKKGRLTGMLKHRWCIIHLNGNVTYYRTRSSTHPKGKFNLSRTSINLIEATPEECHKSSSRQKKNSKCHSSFELLLPARPWGKIAIHVQGHDSTLHIVKLLEAYTDYSKQYHIKRYLHLFQYSSKSSSNTLLNDALYSHDDDELASLQHYSDFILFNRVYNMTMKSLNVSSSIDKVGKTNRNYQRASLKFESLEDSSGTSRGLMNEIHQGDRILSEYEILRVIGRGGFGKVFLARSKVNGEIFAIKSLNKQAIIARNQVEHTMSERRILESSRHPFIVRMHRSFQTQTHLHMVLDFCPGGELFHQLTKLGRFDEEQAAFYGAEVVLALHHLHDNGIVYRDLKPENVLLDATGHVRLADFGLAKENMFGDSITSSFCGSADYLAPEILLIAQDIPTSGYGIAVDYWSLGCFLFEILTGLPPFYSGQNRNKLYSKIRSGDVVYPTYLSKDAVDLLSNLLQVDHTKRLGTGKDGFFKIIHHPFFNSVDWRLLLTRKAIPPLVPKLKSTIDTSYFDKEFTRLSIKSESDAGGAPLSMDAFANFTWQSE